MGLTNGGRARSFEALRDSEELHRTVLSNISDAVFLTTDDGEFTFICPNVDVIFGYVPDEVQAMQRISCLLGDNLFDLAQLDAHGEIQNIEREVTSKSGERRTLLIHAKRVAIKGGTVLFACRDVTERKAAEEAARLARAELAHASRLAVVGELAASIVHEVRQPLSAVASNASAGLRVLEEASDIGDVSAVRECLNDVNTQTQLASEVIERVRSLVRKQAFQLEPLDVNDLVTDLQRIVGGEAKLRGITLRSELSTSTLRASADRVSLRQVVLNLIVNAMDAVSQQPSAREVVVRTGARSNAVEVTVSDTGPGVSRTVASRLFEPFFTTKKDGVGLGLRISRSLIEAQGGEISLVDGVSGGATFSVTVPAVY